MGKKSKLGILGASLLAGSLAFVPKTYAQDSTKTHLNRIYSRDVENSAAGEGILLKNFVPYDISDSVNLRNFNLYSQKGNLSYDAIDTKKGLANAISFLRGRTLTPEVRASISNLERLSQSVPETDNASLETLRRAVSDEVITSQEMSGIKPGTYVIMARSPAIDGYGAQSIPILVNVVRRGRVVPPVVRTDTVTIREPARTDTVKIPIEDERGKPSSRLFFDGFVGENEMVGAGIGIGYGPVGLSVNYTQSGDRTVKELTAPLSNGRYGTGREREIDFKSVGFAAEINPFRHFFLGGGINFGNYTRRVEESIVSAEGDTLATNTNSRSETKSSSRVYAGVDVPLSNRLGLRVFGGYDSRNGAWGGLGGRFKLNRRQHR